MPGFMHAIKSHLPQSPFSPPKKGVPTPEVMTPTTEVSLNEGQPTGEILPEEAVLQPNSSTVALTLTPANGESSQELSADETEVTELEVESTTPLDAEPTEVELETVESVQPTPEISTADASESEASSSLESNAAVESSPALETETTISTELTNVGVPQDETTSPSVQAVEDVVATGEEAPATPTEAENSCEAASHQVDSVKPCAKSSKESCPIKRSKSKKNKSNLPDPLEVGESTLCKPRKSNPLAGKFRSVIDQVRSKVKKDKEALANKPETLVPPPVQVIEPAPICEEIVATA